MSTEPQRETDEARVGTIEVLLAQLKETLDKQFHAIDGLDQKAGIVLGSASLVVALIAVLANPFLQNPLHSNAACPLMRWAFVVGAAFYIAVIFFVVRAFSVETYHLPLRLDAEEIRKEYLGRTAADAREHLLADHIKHCSTNANIIAEKAKWVQWSLYALGGNTAYLTLVVIAATLSSSV
jgi:hypothetical protein